MHIKIDEVIKFAFNFACKHCDTVESVSESESCGIYHVKCGFFEMEKTLSYHYF